MQYDSDIFKIYFLLNCCKSLWMPVVNSEFLTDVSGNWARLAGMHMYISCHSFAAIQIQNSWDTVTLKKKQLCTDIWLNIFYIKNDDVYSCSLYRIYWILLIWIIFFLNCIRYSILRTIFFILLLQINSEVDFLFSLATWSLYKACLI